MTDALKRYQELTANGAEPASPVERLRAFCSLAMGGQDWLDVEPFFDAILAHVEAQEAEISGLRSDLESYMAAANGYLADVETQAAEIERLRAALTLVMDYPEVRKYLGSLVSDVADAALKEQR